MNKNYPLYEVPEIKNAVYASLDAACRPDTVLASTTSAMNVYDVVQVSHPERVLIAHFNNPSHVIPLVEVVAGPDTQQDLLDDIRALLLSIGKAPAVLNKYVPGFIVNRLTAALLRECSYLVDNGLASPEDVDTAFIMLGVVYLVVLTFGCVTGGMYHKIRKYLI